MEEPKGTYCMLTILGRLIWGYTQAYLGPTSEEYEKHIFRIEGKKPENMSLEKMCFLYDFLYKK